MNYLSDLMIHVFFLHFLVYHVKCIDEWLLKNNRSCPVCKRKVLPGDDSDDDESSSNGDTRVNNNHTEVTVNEHQRSQLDTEEDQALIDTTVENENEDDGDDDEDSETSRLINQRSNVKIVKISSSSPPQATTIVSMIPSQIVDNSNSINADLSSSNGSHYGSITQLNNIATASPSVELDLKLPAVFTKKQQKSKHRIRKNNIKKEKKARPQQETASAILKSDSDDELLEIYHADDDNQLNTNDTSLLIPDVQTDTSSVTSSNNQNRTTSKINKIDFFKSV